MKMAVIFGVFHMTLGILCKATNMIYFKKYLEFFTEVCTGIVILLGLFGWMDALIIAKWLYPNDIQDFTPSSVKSSINNAGEPSNDALQVAYKSVGDQRNERMPSIINIMITTAFAFGDSTADKKAGTIAVIGGDIDTEYSISLGLFILVIVLIPVMLLVKPCMVRSHGHDDIDEIEIQDVHGNADMQQQLIQPGIQNRNGSFDEDLSGKNLTDKVMARRENEMKSLEA
jgi:vacuolar-type H+-ATPase subunit I/STV1